MTGIFTDAEIIALAMLTFGYVDDTQGCVPATIKALDHLDEMGFVHKRVRPGLTTWTLREVPPMAQEAVRREVARIEEAVRADAGSVATNEILRP